MKVVGATQGSAQESKTNEVSTEFKVLKIEKQRMKKIDGLEDTAG